MKKILFVTLLLFVALELFANPIEIQLFPDSQIPGKKASHFKSSPMDNDLYIEAVKTPKLEFYKASSNKPTSCIIIAPGGAYNVLSYIKEGTEIAKFLNSLNISAAVITYRVPNMKNEAFSDMQRAVSLLRTHAKTYNLDPKKIGVMGFSAGAHLAARVSTNYLTKNYPTIDQIDHTSARPDFTILIYPAYCGKNASEVSSDLPVNAQTPPAFIAQSQNDHHYVASATAYYLALTQNGVPCDLHIFSKGGHGYGMRSTQTNWSPLLIDWLKKFQ